MIFFLPYSSETLTSKNMDAKALAKSKRAHSLHHKKKHQPHQASKAPSVGSDDKKPSGKQVKEKPLQPHSQQANEKPLKSHGPKPLPSNWGRYDDDFDLGSEEAQPTEFVVPKSKGADYAYLISEAKAQSQVQYTPDDVRLFDDFINGMFCAFHFFWHLLGVAPMSIIICHNKYGMSTVITDKWLLFEGEIHCIKRYKQVDVSKIRWKEYWSNYIVRSQLSAPMGTKRYFICMLS